jgi:hypothetical protein
LFLRKRHFSRQKLANAAEICDLNIDPRRVKKCKDFCPIGKKCSGQNCQKVFSAVVSKAGDNQCDLKGF